MTNPLNGAGGVARDGREEAYAEELWLEGPSAFFLHPEGPLSDTTPEQWRSQNGAENKARPKVTRLKDWDARLSATIMEWRERPFRWDRDCARWAAACVIAQTGDDPLADLRGQYRTKREALKLLATKPMPEYLDERFPRVPTALARRGDIALTQGNYLGIVIAGDALFFVEGMLKPLARAEWEGTWGVGRNG